MKSLISILVILMLGINTAYAELKYKTNRVEIEFQQLIDENTWLASIIVGTKMYVKDKYSKNLTITHIYRTQYEQDKYYKGKKKFRSPHQDWLAVDLRSRNFTEKEIKSIVNYINNTYNNNNTYIPTAFYHDIGLGKHIHIQFKERK